MTEKIGLIVGMENTFPPAFIAKVNETPGFHADLITVGAIKERITQGGYNDYRVIVDRLSHEVPFYRFFLKAAALAGTYVINDPFWWSSDDKFFGFSLAAKNRRRGSAHGDASAKVVHERHRYPALAS